MADPCTLSSGEVVAASTARADCAPTPGAVLRFADDMVSVPPAPLPVFPSPKVAPMPEPVTAPVPVEATPVPATLTATTASAPVAPTPQDVASVVQAGGGGAVGLAAAFLAVVGGGAAWKFYSQRSEQQHALAMERLKMEQAAAGLNGAQPPPCQTANAALEQKLAALTSRVEAAEAAAKKGASLSADFDGEALERRVQRLAKAVKELQESRE